mgnify:CR=1 FL=1
MKKKYLTPSILVVTMRSASLMQTSSLEYDPNNARRGNASDAA